MILNRKVRVLTLDGGGVRGILSAQILFNIEKTLREQYGENFKIGDYFDMIAGTSTGGIITSLLLLKDDNGNLMYDAKDIVDLYFNNNSKIFKKTFWHHIKTIFGFFGSEFQEDGLEELLNQYLGDKELKDLKKPSIICSYDTTKRTCILFKQHLAEQDSSYNFYLKDVVRATSAAPTYFKPAKINSLSGDEYSLIDGGIYANNPTMCALIEVNKVFEKENGRKFGVKDIKILSIGTGGYKRSFFWDKIKHWGIVHWIKPFIDMSMSATNEVTDYQVKKAYEYIDASDNYLRLDVALEKEDSSMDNTNKSNLNTLMSIGDNIFMINKDSIKKFIEL